MSKELSSEDIKNILTDLKRYKESKEYKEIEKRLENIIESDRALIINSYKEGTVDHTQKYSFHCMKNTESEVFQKFIDDIKADGTGIDELKKVVLEKIEENDDALVSRIHQYGQPYTILSYTDSDKKRFLTVSRKVLLGLIDDVMDMYKPEEKKEETTEDTYE